MFGFNNFSGILVSRRGAGKVLVAKDMFHITIQQDEPDIWPGGP